MTFNDFCKAHDCNADEHRELGWYLVYLRMRKTITAVFGVFH